MPGHDAARNLLAAGPGQDDRYASAASHPNVADRRKARQPETVSYAVQNGSKPKFLVSLKGRVQWALERLITAGARGCTPITKPAPRWSAYVHELRALGVNVETLHEPHAGEFPGTHRLYLLRSTVRRAMRGGGA